MKEPIRIYNRIWKNVGIALVSLLFAVLCVWMFVDPHGTLHYTPLFIKIVGSVGTLFFGGGGLVILWMTWKTRRSGKPYITIYDDCFEVFMARKRNLEVAFRDVADFRLVSSSSNRFIAIDYLPSVLQEKMDEANVAVRTMMKLNMATTNAIESVKVDDLTMKPQEILEELNRRLEK